MNGDIEKKICVVGLGYIGLPTASLLATKGYEVNGVDVSRHVVETINEGKIHIREPDLDILVKSAVQSGRLKASLEPVEADIFILAVPTPFKGDHEPDVSYVEAATRSIAPYLKPGNLVILESTSPVGTTEEVSAWIAEERKDLELPKRGYQVSDKASENRVHVAHCPERVLPGHILRELVENDRIVGGVDELSTQAAAEFYHTFVSGEVLETECRTAELAKLSENTFRDVNIAFANELSMICEKLDIDVWQLIRLANHHPRVNILNPGPGVGGHCIAVDPWFVIHSAPETARVIKAAREVNVEKPHHVVGRVKAKAKRFKEPTIACFGLAYKPNIDDLRESPAIEITHAIATESVGKILVVEPHISELPTNLRPLRVELVSIEDGLNRADIVVGLVAHRAFGKIRISHLRETIVLDVCGIWTQDFALPK